MRNLVLSLVLGVSLTACGTDPTKSAVYTCTTAATLIDVATAGVASGKIKMEDKPKIEAAIGKVAVVCENDTPPNADQLQQSAIEELVKLLHDKGVM